MFTLFWEFCPYYFKYPLTFFDVESKNPYFTLWIFIQINTCCFYSCNNYALICFPNIYTYIYAYTHIHAQSIPCIKIKGFSFCYSPSIVKNHVRFFPLVFLAVGWWSKLWAQFCAFEHRASKQGQCPRGLGCRSLLVQLHVLRSFKEIVGFSSVFFCLYLIIFIVIFFFF